MRDGWNKPGKFGGDARCGRMRATALILLVLLAAPACKKIQPRAVKEAQAEHDAAQDKRIRQACASQASYERLKALAFEKAKDVRQGDTAVLDRLGATTVVRMEDPVVKSRDESLNVTVCRGKMVIDLPPGTEDAFNGDRQLTADVEYAAQAAADGSGLVYQLDGAEPIIYRLAAIDLKNGGRSAQPGAGPGPSPAPEVQVAENTAPAPVVTPPPAPETRARPPAPRPAPTRVATALPRPAMPRVTSEPPRPAQARPSFNCRYARTPSELMVCGDERLASRDRAMASLYYQAIAQTDPETRAMLRGTRDRFLARRERCRNPACVAAAYEDRMDEIDHIASGDWAR